MGLFDGTPLESLVTCTTCGALAKECKCPPADESEPLWEPERQTVFLRKEKRARGKLVTTIGGLMGTPAQVQRLLKELKAVCGAGGTCGDGVVELQGDHVERLQKWMLERGYRLKKSKQ